MDKEYDIDAEAKKLYDKYSGCIYCRVDNKGQASCKPMAVEYVEIDKHGHVYVSWDDTGYGDIKRAPFNAVRFAFDNYIEGIFKDECCAKDAAKKHFEAIKLRKIAELEAEIEALKKSIE